MVKGHGATTTAKLHVTIIDHHMNQCTPWLADIQIYPRRLRILGDPSSRTIDTQIPTYRDQTCEEAIRLILQIIGSEQGPTPIEKGEILVLASSPPIGGCARPAPTESESTGLLLLQHHSLIYPNIRLTMFLPNTTTKTTRTSACLAADTDIRLSDGSYAPVQHSVGRNIWTDQLQPRTIIRIHKFDTQATDPPLCFIKGNGMTESHFIRRSMESKWCRASDFVDDKIRHRVTSKGPVFAVELDTDDYLTLRGDIQAATFGNCLIVEPHRQGYTHDFRSKMDQALRARGLHKADLIEWHHGAVGHRADGSLLLETGLIKTSSLKRGGVDDTSTAGPTHLAHQRAYRVCGKCHKPDARLKCTCLSTYYCDTDCQREDLPFHRLVCTDMIRKDITLLRRQIHQQNEDQGQFTMEVARLELIHTETHVKLGDLLRTSGRGTTSKTRKNTISRPSKK